MYRQVFILWQLLCLFLWETRGFSLDRGKIAGIWKMKLDPAASLNKKSGSSIMIKLKEDGSFQQFDDEEQDDYLEGCWDFEDSDSKLQLAIDRQCLSGRADTLLSGKVSGEDGTVAKGDVSAGRFMYPQSHLAFFDQVMAASEVVGKFSLKQVMAFSSMGMSSQETAQEEEKSPNFKAEDFFGQKFVMTVVPVECKVKPQEVWNKETRQWTSPLDNQAVDIRTMPIQFFANSTFEALGVNKILRGRFEVTKDDKLWFHVSRFGMGRSTPGSVYSEGIGLSHEDERTYVGQIESSVSLRVEGKVTFGNDLGTDARPEPVGTFILHSVDDAPLDMETEDEDRSESAADDDIFNSVFE